MDAKHGAWFGLLLALIIIGASCKSSETPSIDKAYVQWFTDRAEPATVLEAPVQEHGLSSVKVKTDKGFERIVLVDPQRELQPDDRVLVVYAEIHDRFSNGHIWVVINEHDLTDSAPSQ